MTHRVTKAIASTILVLCVVGFWTSLSPRGQNQNRALSRWRPTRELAGVRYVGSSVCAQCHTGQAAKRWPNLMGRALEPTANCEVLKTHPRMSFRNGPYTYHIVRDGSRSIYTVTDGINAISEPILYCFGQGKAGQTYVFRHNGVFFESRVSYYQETQGLDFTIIHPHAVPESVEAGLGRAMTEEAAQGCFACHSTGAISGSQLQLDNLMPGVTCEGCHGPGEKHIAAVKEKNFRNLEIFNPANMDANDLTQQFCGACHVSFEKALLMPMQGGRNNIRYQPYRIFNSRGHSGDARISCIGCHNPHDKLEESAAYYDSKCLACHLTLPGAVKTASRSAPACPVAKRRCVTCHMQKVELPGSHDKFTDHWIRIVKPGDPIPN
ncbi:MAG TPA: multiheme c-type cytochrome [Pyrinomonadaceae bacterium]